MVEIREETQAEDEQRQHGSQQSQQDEQNTGTTGTSSAGNNSQRKTPMEFIKENPNELLSFGLRLATLYFVIMYILPVSNPQFQKTAYTKAFGAAAATNAFRLHQRLRTVNVPVFSQHFLFELMMEDSAHYLFYCLILAMNSQITLALLPISIYALFNIINFINKFSIEVGYISPTIASFLVQFKQQHSVNMLSTIALSEIFLFPILVMMIFFGGSLFVPFIYYRFISMRYLSRRNPYTREMFTQLKYLLFTVSNHQNCPHLVKSLILKFVSLVERLAPQMPTM